MQLNGAGAGQAQPGAARARQAARRPPSHRDGLRLLHGRRPARARASRRAESLTVSGPFAERSWRRRGQSRVAAATRASAARGRRARARQLILDEESAGRFGDRRRIGRRGGGAAAADPTVGHRSGPCARRSRRRSVRDVPACLLSMTGARRRGGGRTSSSIDARRSAARPCCWSIRASRCRPPTCSRAGTGSIRGRSSDWRDGRNDLEAAGDRAGAADRRRCSPGSRRSRARTSSACPAAGATCFALVRQRGGARPGRRWQCRGEWWHLATYLR